MSGESLSLFLRILLTLIALMGFLASGGLSAAWACDPCALFSASRLQAPLENSLTLSLSDQFTQFKRGSDLSEGTIRDGELVKAYSTTQLGVSYGVTNSFSLQLALPFIYRELDRIQNYRTSERQDSGLGDLNALASYTYLNKRFGDFDVLSSVYGGLKFPTGETGALGEVSDEVTQASPQKGALKPKHHVLSGVSGGRALAFGSGSYDVVSGINFLVRKERFFVLTSAQYTFRNGGAFEYEFADDTVFSVVPSYYLSLAHDMTISGGLAFSGELKDKDRLKGALVRGSSISNFYLGPDFLFTFGNGFGGEVAVDFRVSDEDAGATVVPENRIRANVFYRF